MRFWNSTSVAAHAMLRHMSHKDEATIVFHEYFNAGCCDMMKLSGNKIIFDLSPPVATFMDL